VDWFEGMVDPVRGVISVPISEQPSYEGGTVFMHGIVGRGLGKYYEATSDPRGMIMALRIGEWITTEPMGPPARFWYKQAPDCKHGFGATSQVMTALSYPYRYTGDEWFANMSEALFAQTGPSVRSAAWYYTSLAHLAPLRTPLRIEMPDGPVIVAPGSPWQGIVKLTNTTLDTVAAQLAGEGAEGLSAIFEPAKLTIASGESVEVTLEIATNTETAGTRELTLRMTSGGKVQARTLPVSIVLDALEAEGDRTWAHVPPEVRANPDPWKADDDAGAITWQVTVPVAGEYTVLAECWWPDAKSNSFWLSVDDGQAREFGNDGRYERWQWIIGPTMRLATGDHTVSLRAREDGARVAQVMLTNARE